MWCSRHSGLGVVAVLNLMHFHKRKHGSNLHSNLCFAGSAVDGKGADGSKPSTPSNSVRV
jgi:hypothetical protein